VSIDPVRLLKVEKAANSVFSQGDDACDIKLLLYFALHNQ